eukprot:749198-Pleurochrysis_carterae.AAC.1
MQKMCASSCWKRRTYVIANPAACFFRIAAGFVDKREVKEGIAPTWPRALETLKSIVHRAGLTFSKLQYRSVSTIEAFDNECECRFRFHN